MLSNRRVNLDTSLQSASFSFALSISTLLREILLARSNYNLIYYFSSC